LSVRNHYLENLHHLSGFATTPLQRVQPLKPTSSEQTSQRNLTSCNTRLVANLTLERGEMPTAFSLHILPPAFSLPSIDAECLAAIAYLTWTLPRSAWTLVAESGFAENQQLPCLRDVSGGKNHEVVVDGFEAIVRHLVQVSRGQWDLDARLNSTAKADCTA
jgi:Outer mitochondrial membrane transport complex protein